MTEKELEKLIADRAEAESEKYTGIKRGDELHTCVPEYKNEFNGFFDGYTQGARDFLAIGKAMMKLEITKSISQNDASWDDLVPIAEADLTRLVGGGG